MKQNMKRLLCALLVCCMALSLTACGSSGSAETAAAATEAPEATATSVPTVKDTMLADLKATAAANAGSEAKYTANDLAVEKVMDQITAENTLAAISQTHSSITATINCVQADGTALYTKVMEADTADQGKSYTLRATHTSPLGSSEIEGSSAAGMLVTKWDDGTTEVSVFADGEFDGLFTETYIENPEVVDYSNITISQDGNVISVEATCTYLDTLDDEYTLGLTLEEYFFLDAEDLHLLAMLDDFHSDEGGTLTGMTFAYDQPYSFEQVSLLNDVTTAADAAPLHVVFSAPEYDNYCETRDYNISLSADVYVDSQGYTTIFTDPALTMESEVENIERNGETTIYVVITSYMLQQELAKEAEEKALATPAPTASPNPNVVVTKSPTSETLNAGGSCMFVAYADNATAVTWQFISADGNTTVLDVNAANYFGGLHISGIGTGVLKLANVPQVMNGWRVQAIFAGKNGPVYTNTATITVNKVKPTPTPAPTTAPTPEPVPVIDVAKTLAQQCRNDVANRAAGFGFTTSDVTNFQANGRASYATFDVVMTKNYITATFHFYVWPEGDYKYAVPVGYEAQQRLSDGTLKYFDMKEFGSTDNETICWSGFGNALVYLSDYADSYDPTPTPTPSPEPTAEPTPVVTDEPIPTPEPTPEVTPEPTPEPTEEPAPEPAEEPAQAS